MKTEYNDFSSYTKKNIRIPIHCAISVAFFAIAITLLTDVRLYESVPQAIRGIITVIGIISATVSLIYIFVARFVAQQEIEKWISCSEQKIDTEMQKLARTIVPNIVVPVFIIIGDAILAFVFL